MRPLLLAALLAGCSDGVKYTSDKGVVDVEDSSAVDSQPDSADDSGATDSAIEDTAPPEHPWPASFFAPFVDATAYPTPRVADISAQTGLTHYALGFIVAAGPNTCEGSWGTWYTLRDGPSAWQDGQEYTLYEQIAQLREQHQGDVLLSFGGAANTPLAAACRSAELLQEAYQEVVDTLSLSQLDFDVEGFWLSDATSVTRRSQALRGLQVDMAAQGRPLKVWLTLPVLPTGLTAPGLAVVRSGLEEGVDLAGVNLMTMNYGDGAAPDPNGQMAEYGAQAVDAVKNQLAELYAERGVTLTDAELYARLGTTPMIGLNDVVSERFDLEDAQQTLQFAQENSLGMLSMWSLNRDHPCPERTTVALDCSSTADQTESYAFTTLFQGFAR